MNRAFVAAVVAALWAGLGAPAAAQIPSLGGGDEPIEIEASHSLEWQEELSLYVARGDARLKQGTVELFADVITAYYRDLPAGGTEIWRLVAEGNVIIESPEERAEGDHMVYDVDQDVIVLTGERLLLETPTEVITARDSLEYWPGRELAVARGDAKAVRDTDEIEADVLTGEFTEDETGNLALNMLRAFGNVLITTPTDIAFGDEGVYNLETNIVTLTGSVRLIRGENQINGDLAEVNLNTGVSRMMAGPSSDGRVRGLLVPDQEG